MSAESPIIAGTGLTSQSMGAENGSQPTVTSLGKNIGHNANCGGNPERSFQSNTHIDSVFQENSTDNQEITGSENQRLPGYEVHTTKKHVSKGLRKCSVNLEGSKKLYSEPVEGEEEEETTFTTGLLSGPVPEGAWELLYGSRVNPNKKPEPVSTTKETLSMTEKWGSNVTDASDSNPTVESESNIVPKALGDKSLKTDISGNPVPTGTIPVLGSSGNKSESQQKPSEKELSKHKNATLGKPVDKENVGKGYVL